MSVFGFAKELLNGRRSLYGSFEDAVRGYRTIRVAVIGSKASGKTVLLASLANHLRDHHPSLFPLGGRIVTWDKDAKIADMPGGLSAFDYEGARAALSSGRWPGKTTSSSMLALRLLVEDSKGVREMVQLELADIPGERVADFAMKGRSFREWSAWMAKESPSESFRAYLDAVRASRANGDSVIFKAYRDFLASEYASYSSVITPSTVKLSLSGVSSGGSPQEFRRAIDVTPVGFVDSSGEIFEFAPLPEECFESAGAWRKVVSRFARAYGKYVDAVVSPLADWMRSADKLVYLVDILGLLQAGSKACEVERQYAQAAIGALCPRESNLIERAARRASRFLWRTQIRDVYVVATKADCVWSQTNRDNLVILADSLLGRPLRFLDSKRVKSAVLSCAAVSSTRERSDGSPGLQGKLANISGGDSAQHAQIVKWRPSEVPSSFPESSEDWETMIKEGRFNYQFAFPWFDEAQMCPPRQLGLDMLADALLSR